MRRILLILLLTIPFIGFGQIIENKKGDRIDITKFKVQYIEITGWGLIPNEIYYGEQDEKGNKLTFKMTFKRKGKFFDGENMIKIYSSSDLINFFTKHGYEYEGTGSGGTYTNYSTKQTYSRVVMTFKNNNL